MKSSKQIQSGLNKNSGQEVAKRPRLATACASLLFILAN